MRKRKIIFATAMDLLQNPAMAGFLMAFRQRDSSGLYGA